MSRTALAGTGDLDDRARLLRHIELEAPEVLKDLATHFTRAKADPRSIDSGLRAWAGRWNLARDGRGEWLITVGLKTFRLWAGYAGPRRVFELGFAGVPVEGPVFIGADAPDPITRDANGPVEFRARTKRKMLDAVKWLPLAPDHHLVALVQWQVLRHTTASVTRRCWPPSETGANVRTVRRKMLELQKRFDLPDRLAD